MSPPEKSATKIVDAKKEMIFIKARPVGVCIFLIVLLIEWSRVTRKVLLRTSSKIVAKQTRQMSDPMSKILFLAAT